MLFGVIYKKKKLTLSLIKYSIYIIEVNITRLIKQLVEKAKKTKLVLKYNYCFKRRSDKIIPTKSINAISSLSDYPVFNSSISDNILKVKSLVLSKDKMLKKTRKKTTTKKLLKEVTKKSKISGDLEKT